MRISDWSSDVCSSDLLGQHDGQHAVLQAVAVEDVGKAGGDERTNAIVVQRPRRVFAAGAAAEVRSRQQDGGTLVAGLVQHESRVRRPRGAILPGLALVQIAPFVEQIAPEACASYPLHELLRDDGRLGRASCRERVCQYL